jgi:hypothetical protein
LVLTAIGGVLNYLSGNSIKHTPGERYLPLLFPLIYQAFMRKPFLVEIHE